MGKVDYLEELHNEGEDPCVTCGSDVWEMNWNTGLYSCGDCGAPLYDKPAKEKKVRLVPKMKYDERDDR